MAYLIEPIVLLTGFQMLGNCAVQFLGEFYIFACPVAAGES